MRSLSVVGVTKINDSYPNVKYKLRLLSSFEEFKYSENLFIINGNKLFYDTSSSFTILAKLLLICKIFYGHILVLFRHILQRSEVVYIAYPGIVFAFMMSVLPFRRSTEIYLDAFISIYDTVVNDRKLFAPSHWVSRLLFFVEKRAFLAAKFVIVDTEENAEFYSQLFGLPKNKFASIPLCIPPIQKKKLNIEPAKFTCVFIGTFVPLQGTRIIIDAALSLAKRNDIEFVFIGDGQDADYLEYKLKAASPQQIAWHRGHFSTEFIAEQLSKADVCLGIFGATNKAQRVLPYKLYYYLAMGMPVVTSRTKIIKRLCENNLTNNAHPVFITCEPGDAKDLAQKIEELACSRDQLREYSNASRQFYESQLSNRIIVSKLRKLFSE